MIIGADLLISRGQGRAFLGTGSCSDAPYTNDFATRAGHVLGSCNKLTLMHRKVKLNDRGKFTNQHPPPTKLRWETRTQPATTSFGRVRRRPRPPTPAAPPTGTGCQSPEFKADAAPGAPNTGGTQAPSTWKWLGKRVQSQSLWVTTTALRYSLHEESMSVTRISLSNYVLLMTLEWRS